MKNYLWVFWALLSIGFVHAQEKLTYQKPSEEILELVNAPLAPSVLINDEGNYMVLLYRDYYKTIAELSETELRLAGLRINPKTNIGSRTNYYNNVIVKKIGDNEGAQVKGLPENPRLANFNWSPDQSKIAFTNTTTEGVEVMVLDLKSATATAITETNVNANMRDIINWFKDGESVLVKMLPEDRKPLINTDEAVPDGPTISTNDGKKAQNRTYQDLLKNPNDEFNFEQLARSELYKVQMDGSKTKWKDADLYTSISFSPDGEHVMTVTLDKPFSYLVPYYRFPNTTTVYKKDGTKVKTLLQVPLIEDLPQGFMATRTGMRDISWRNDKPATLTYVEALDGGDPENEVPYRDEVFEIEAPFDGEGKSILKTKNRFSYIQWGNDNVAIAHDRWWNNRNTKTYLFNPSNPDAEAKIIEDRNYQDVYSNPGSFVTKRNENGAWVLSLDKNNNAYLIGDGYTEEGQFPFVEKMDLNL